MYACENQIFLLKNNPELYNIICFAWEKTSCTLSLSEGNESTVKLKSKPNRAGAEQSQVAGNFPSLILQIIKILVNISLLVIFRPREHVPNFVFAFCNTTLTRRCFSLKGGVLGVKIKPKCEHEIVTQTPWHLALSKSPLHLDPPGEWHGL